MILNALVERLKRQSKGDFKGRHFEASLILQAVSWYLRYPLSYRGIEEMLLERGFEVDHSTLNRWVLAYAPAVEGRRPALPPRRARHLGAAPGAPLRGPSPHPQPLGLGLRAADRAAAPRLPPAALR